MSQPTQTQTKSDAYAIIKRLARKLKADPVLQAKVNRPIAEVLEATAPLHPAQLEIYNYPARYKVVVCGRRFGKTTLGARLVLQAALEGKRVWWIAPTYPLASIGWRMIKKLAYDSGLDYTLRESELMLKGVGDGWLQVKSASDRDKMRGEGLDGLVIDEAAYVDPHAWTDVLRPALADKKGWAMFISTPNGFNYFHELFLLGLGGNPDWKSWQMPSVANTSIEGFAEEIEAAKATMDIVTFRQEFEAKFEALSGRVFDQFEATENVSVDAEYNPAFGDILWGVDDGYAHGDGPGSLSYHPRVIILAQRTPIGGINVFFERVATGESDYNTAIDAIIGSQDGTIERRYPNPEIAFVDSSAAMFRGAMNERGIVTTAATHKVYEGIRNVRRLVVDGHGVRLLKIHPRCINMIKEMETYQFAEDGATAGERTPMKKNDHCFVAGTMVTTEHGEKPIELIKKGDRVLTRAGYQSVILAGITNPEAEIYTAEFNNGCILQGTGDHPVWTENRGFIALKNLNLRDTVCASYNTQQGDAWLRKPQIQSRSSIKELPLDGIQIQSDGQIIFTTDHIQVISTRELKRFTEKFGKMLTGQFLKGTKFITKIVIQTTTILKISLVLLLRNTSEYIGIYLLQNSMNERVKRLGISKNSVRNGMEAPIEFFGIPQMVKNHLKFGNLLKWFVRSAKRNLRHILTINLNFAQTTVNQKRADNQALITKQEIVNVVTTNSFATNTQEKSTAQVVVLHTSVKSVKKTSDVAPVYNLTVDCVPEYFANSILVHNCSDAIRYMLWHMRSSE